MKIAYISSTSSGMHDHSIYFDLLEEIMNNGHEVTIIYAREKRFGLNTEMYFSKGIRYLGIRTGNLTKNPNLLDKAWATLRFDSLFLSAIKDNLGNIEFDMVLFSTPPITFNKTLLYFKNKGVFIYLMLKDIFPQNAVDMRMIGKNSLVYRYFRLKEKRIYNDSNIIGAMSEQNIKYLHDNNNLTTPVELLPNSLKVINKVSKGDRKQFDLSDEDVLLLYGGNLGIPQGVDFILECMEKVEKMAGVKLIICGSGSEADKIRFKIKKELLENTIYYGQLEQEKYKELTSVVDIGLIFLDYKFTIPNYPQRVLSYMEAKLPVICATDVVTDVGTDASLNGYGLSVESNDVNKWEEAVNQLVNNPELRVKMGNKGFEFLKGNFNVSSAAETILKHKK